MTVSYSHAAYTYKLCTILSLLFRWRGSVYKLILTELVVYCLMHSSITVVYLTVIKPENGTMKSQFDRFSTFAKNMVDHGPLTFVLGIYVQIIMSRWFQYFLAIPWPVKLGLLITTYVRGQDDEGRKIRRTIMRHALAAFILATRRISVQVRRRFPHICDLVQAGLLTKAEYESLKHYRRAQFTPKDEESPTTDPDTKGTWQSTDVNTNTGRGALASQPDASSSPSPRIESERDSYMQEGGDVDASNSLIDGEANDDGEAIGRVVEEEADEDDSADAYATFFVPCVWAANLVNTAFKRRRILSPFGRSDLIAEIDAFRTGLQRLFSYDCVPLPLVYSQVVWIAVYSYFLLLLPAGQPIDREMRNREFVDVFNIPVPIYVYLQFFIYVGLLKVAETSLNPMGLDDDDFELDEIIDFDVEVGFLLVDQLHDDLPCGYRLGDLEDPHNGRVHIHLPHTVASNQRYRRVLDSAIAPYMGSASILTVNEAGRVTRPRKPSIAEHQRHVGDVESGSTMIRRQSQYRVPTSLASGLELRTMQTERESSPPSEDQRTAKKNEQRKMALEKWTSRMQATARSRDTDQIALPTSNDSLSAADSVAQNGHNQLASAETGEGKAAEDGSVTPLINSAQNRQSASAYAVNPESAAAPRCIDDEDAEMNGDDYFWLLPFRDADEMEETAHERERAGS